MRNPPGRVTILTGTAPSGGRHFDHLAGEHGARLDAPAQADRGGLNETPFDHRVQPFRPGQHLDVRGKSAFLAERRQLDHIQDALGRAQRLQAARQLLGALIVHFEAEHGDLLVLPPAALAVIHDDAQHVADAGQAARAEAAAGRAQPP